MIKPMLLGSIPAPAPGEPWSKVAKRLPADTVFEVKLDGFRMVAEKRGEVVRLYGRAGNDWTPEYPEIVESIRAIPLDEVTLDGEIVVLGPDGWPSFNDLQNRMRLPKSRRARDLRFMAFDVLSFGGQSITGHPFTSRRQVLEKIVPLAGPAIGMSEQSTDGESMWADVMEHSLEGLVAKSPAGKYAQGEAGREQWFKIKARKTGTFEVVGFTPGTGSRSDTFGALVLAERDGDELTVAGSVGTGFNDATLRALSAKLESLRVPTSPYGRRFTASVAGKNVTWIAEGLSGLVEYDDRSASGRLLKPSWKGETTWR